MKKLLSVTIVSSLIFVIFVSTYLLVLQLTTKRPVSLNTPQTAYFEIGEGALDLFPVDIYEQDIFEEACNYKPKASIQAPTQPSIGYSNNKFGMYAYDVESLIVKAAEFANSNGGDWGYVLLPVNISEKDEGKMRRVFEQFNKLHLIPVIQLWDYKPDSYIQDTNNLADMLNTMPWPIEKRYISVYNEVNDDAFWPGGRDPVEYAKVLDETIDIFKARDSRYFLMNGAFNTSARSGINYTSTDTFLQQMHNSNPNVLNKLDGWASHPYPQPNFAGSVHKTGRDGIRAYEWEINVLRKLGVSTVNLPVFITETGWAHREGEVPNFLYLSDAKAAVNLKIAFLNYWLPDQRVVAVMPFTIIYDAPHDHFSFLRKDGSPYKVYTEIKNLPKKQGNPPLSQSYFEITNNLPLCELY